MPILQTRVVAVVNAGIDYQKALYKLIALIKREYQNAIASGNHEQALANIFAQTDHRTLLEDPENSWYALRKEYDHFVQHIERNKREAARMRHRRFLQGDTPQRLQYSSSDTTDLRRIANTQSLNEYESFTTNTPQLPRNEEAYARPKPVPYIPGDDADLDFSKDEVSNDDFSDTGI
jgi:hypothetical protein